MLVAYMLHVGFEISLAYRNLMGFARLDPRVASGVRFELREFRMEQFASGLIKVNDFAPFTEMEKALMEVAELQPDVLCISCYIWNAQPLLAFCQRAKALSPDTLIVAGGPEVAYTAKETLTRWPSVDVVVSGEGEEIFRDLLLTLLDDGREALVGQPGTTVRASSGEIIAGPPRAPLADINAIPSPWTQALDEQDPALDHFDRSIIFETLRGCVYKCAFCLYGKGFFSARYYDEERVFAELSRLLLAGYTVQVVDPIFGLHIKRTKRLLSRLAELDYSGGLRIESYAELIDPEMADLFKAARVQQIGVGLQSVGTTAIKEMDRRFRLERFARNLTYMGEIGLPYYIDVIYGLPEDTYAGFLETIDFALGFENADLEIYRLLALPGTRYHDEAARYGLRYSPEPPYETYGCDSFPYSDVVKAHKIAQTYKLLRAATGRPWALAGVWRKHYDNRPSAFLTDLAGYLEGRNLLDFFSSDALANANFVIRQYLADFLEGRELVKVVEEAGVA